MVKKVWRWLIATRGRRIVLVAVGAIFVIGVASLFEPIYGQVCHYNDYHERENCHPYRLAIALLYWVSDFVDDSSAFVTATATAILTWVTYRLVQLGKDDGNTQRAQLRAYVSATAESIRLETDEDVLRAFVQIKNNGNTPAFNIRIPSAVSIKNEKTKFLIADALPFTPDEINSLANFTLASGKDSVNSPNSEFTDFGIIRNMPAGYRLYVFGLVIYKDIFGDEQWVEFCHFLPRDKAIEAFNLATKNRGKKIDAPFEIASFGNDVSFNPDHALTMAEHNRTQRELDGN